MVFTIDPGYGGYEIRGTEDNLLYFYDGTNPATIPSLTLLPTLQCRHSIITTYCAAMLARIFISRNLHMHTLILILIPRIFHIIIIIIINLWNIISNSTHYTITTITTTITTTVNFNLLTSSSNITITTTAFINSNQYYYYYYCYYCSLIIMCFKLSSALGVLNIVPAFCLDGQVFFLFHSC